MNESRDTPPPLLMKRSPEIESDSGGQTVIWHLYRYRQETQAHTVADGPRVDEGKGREKRVFDPRERRTRSAHCIVSSRCGANGNRRRARTSGGTMFIYTLTHIGRVVDAMLEFFKRSPDRHYFSTQS